MMLQRVALGGLVLALSMAAPAQGEPDETWYAEALTELPTGPSITYFWSSGRSLRAMTVVQGRPIVTMVHRDWYYVVDEMNGVGLAVERSQRALKEDATGLRPFAQEVELILKEGAEVVRTEESGGRTLRVYRLTDDQSRREVWTPDGGPRIPIRVEVFDRAVGQKRVVQYISWDRGLKIPERYFRPDARIRLDRMSYEDYLRITANGPTALPVLYGALLHGLAREDG